MKEKIRYPKRLIEVDLPIKQISAHARREKSIRHGHISTLHIWWARRPLAACRAVICATLWPDPADDICPKAFRNAAADALYAFAGKVRTEKQLAKLCASTWVRWKKLTKGYWQLDKKKSLKDMRGALLDFIADFANWDSSTVPAFLETSRVLTQAAHESLGGEPGTKPFVVDPFAGGGSIPLESLRVGADAFASDLNPIAVLLNKVILEFIPKYGQRLADGVRRWGGWIKKEAENELADFYPKGSDGATPIAYLWARTVLSEAPGQGKVPVEIPLIRSMWLAKKSSRRRALRWVRNENGQIQTQKLRLKFSDGTTRDIIRPLLEVFEPTSDTTVESGTSAGGSVTCPITGFTMAVERVRHQLEPRNGGAIDSRLVCVVEVHPGKTGRFYRLPTPSEMSVNDKASIWLEEYLRNRKSEDPRIPDGSINHLRGFFNIVLYGMKTWGDLFNPRQLVILLTLGRLVRRAGEQMDEPGISTAIETCLALVLGRMADGNSSLARWQTVGEKISNTFGRQALPMVWDFAEANPFCEATRSLESMFQWIIDVITHEASNHTCGSAERASATNHFLPDDSADAVITDPPYYAAVPYADLSDFFYSWLAQTLRPRFPDLFAEQLTPKADECVQLSHRAAMYRNKDKLWFEDMMAKACDQARRVTKPEGTGLFVFASKETNAWEAMLAALVNTGWIVTASWPIDTEMFSRLRAQESATLASSIHIICRPRENPDGSVRTDEIGDWRDVLAELPKRIHDWMPRLAKEGVVGADAIFSCLGPALEIFSCYSRVEKASGEQITLKEYLEHVWAAVSKEALSMIFTGADATGFEEDARLTAMWLWTLSTGNGGVSGKNEESEVAEKDKGIESKSGKAKLSGFMLEYDAARKIAQGLGAHLEALASLVEIKGDKARLLPVAERTAHLFGKGDDPVPSARKKKKKQLALGFAAELEQAEEYGGWDKKGAPPKADTVLDRIHQAMILFAAGRSEALKRFLVDEGAGRDEKFWRLAQALSALYPPSCEEKRWVDGVMARKKGLGL
ncbi:DUF1156 domain-containing protein [Myxococcota bacterium]